MKDDAVYLQHILEAVEKIEDYLRDYNFETFADDSKTVDAVIRELEIIGEAARNLSDELKDKYSEIPLREAMDMRNVLIHEYFGVNKKIVWDTCQIDLKSLKEAIKKISA